MRELGVLAIVLVLAVLVPTVPVAAPHIGGSRLDPVVVLWGCSAGAVGVCTFTVQTWNASIIFFQYDLNADGVADFPVQTGCPSLGCWTTLTSIRWQVPQPFPGACARGWDGVGTRLMNGTIRPLTPIGCTDFAAFLPRWWSRYAPGRFVLVKLTIPSWLAPKDFDTPRAEVEGLPGIPVVYLGHTVFFRVDRAALTRLLGPGVNTVHLTLPWAERTFTAAGVVTIL